MTGSTMCQFSELENTYLQILLIINANRRETGKLVEWKQRKEELH